MTPKEAASTIDLALFPPRSSSSVKLKFRENVRRIYATWWDIINTSVLLFFVFCCLVALALALAKDSSITLLGADILTAERKVEISLGILGLSVSGGSAVALWLLNKGVERWSVISRIYYLHRYIFKTLGPESAGAIEDILSSYGTLSDEHFENVNVCHPIVQKYYEELRLLILMNHERLGADYLRAEVSFRCFMIALMTKGFLKGVNLDEALTETCRKRALATHGIETT